MSEERENIISLFNKYADHYQEKYMDVSKYHDTLDHFCGSIKNNKPRILEVGCGPGNVTRYILSQLPGALLLGIDIADEMILRAKKANPDAAFQVMDCRDIANLKTKFDGLVAGFCLPYLNKAEAITFIRTAASVLNPGAAIYLSTMEGKNDESGYQESSVDSNDQLIINFHEEQYLWEALKSSGFISIESFRLIYPSDNGKSITDLVMTAVLKQ